MARKREIGRGFYTDEDLAERSVWARLLFPGLWQLADREGRLEDRPAWIRVQVFPYDNLEGISVSMSGLLDELARPKRHSPRAPEPFIIRYEVDGRRYIQIVNFAKHQHLHPNEPPSKLPAPPKVAAISESRPVVAPEPTRADPAMSSKPSMSSVPSVPSVPSGGGCEDARSRPANPLVDRDAMVSEGHGLIRSIAPLANLDPTEVLSKASKWRGNSYVRLDIIPDDRMAHTLEALRRWHRSLTGQSDPGPPAPTEARASPSPAAQAREDAANAMIRGGLSDRGKLGRGNEIAAGDDAGPGHDPGDARAPRAALPAGPGPPDR